MMPGSLGPPLEGVRVADFSWVWSGPYATHLLALLGADVIRIESRLRPELTRANGPFVGGKLQGDVNESLWYNGVNPCKRSLSLNLATEDGIMIAKELVAQSDVVVSNFRPGVLKRLGLGYEALQQVKPDVILVQCSLNGEGGPRDGWAGYGPNAQVQSGFASVTGYREGPPSQPATPVADSITAGHIAVAIMAALHRRDRVGAGELIEVSMTEAMASVMGSALLAEQAGFVVERKGNESDMLVPNSCYRCADEGGRERWVSICVATDEEWRALIEVIGDKSLFVPQLAELQGRIAARGDIDALVSSWIGDRNGDAVVELLQQRGIAAARVLDIADLLVDAQLAASEFFVGVDHPSTHWQPVATYPFEIAGYRPRVHPSPLLGQHTREILRDLLGYGNDIIDGFERNGVLT